MQIVNFFYELARQHKQIKGFFYGKAYEKGAANEAHPLIWLDDPIYGKSDSQTLSYTCNVDILGIPENGKDVLDVQTAAFNVGLALAEKIQRIYRFTGFKADGFTFVSLRDYYDNSAAGYRFTYTIVQATPVNRGNDDFDPSKQFSKIDALPEFRVENPDGCAVFIKKTGLPNFKITNPDGCTVFDDNE
jgi:hypothetical protein